MFEKNLKYYRLKKNMKIKDLAEACSVTPMAISNYESGKRKPDMDTIKKLADALGIHVVDFISSRNNNLVFKHKEFRKNSKLTISQQEFVRESVEEYFSRFFDTVECIGGNPLPAPPNCYILTSTGNFEDDSVELRKCLGFQNCGPIDELIGILESRGFMILEIDIDNDGFSGMNGYVNEYPYIVINKNMTPERKRTTIVHELTHLMFKFDESDTVDEKKVTAIAGAFLLPKDDLTRMLGLHRTTLTKDMIFVCEEYGVSMFLLVIRASQIGIISESLLKSFYIRANKANWKKNEPQRVRNIEEPKLLKQLVLRAINEGEISIQRGAELLNQSWTEVNNYCGLMEV